MMNTGRNTNPFQFVLGIVALAAGLWLLFFIAKGIFSVLSFISPFLLIATFFIRKQVIFNYIKTLGKIFKSNPVVGVVAMVLSVVGFPVLSLLLFGRALLGKKADEIKEQERAYYGDNIYRDKEDFTDYEEIEDDPLDLPPLEKVRREPPRRSSTNYEDLL